MIKEHRLSSLWATLLSHRLESLCSCVNHVVEGERPREPNRATRAMLRTARGDARPPLLHKKSVPISSLIAIVNSVVIATFIVSHRATEAQRYTEENDGVTE